MKLVWSRKSAPEPAPPPSFGAWALHSFAMDEPLSGMTFARLEQVCSNAASLLCGAAYAEGGAIVPETAGEPAEEARIVAKRTADGFKAALADRDRAVLAWPWDHIATRVAWQATRDGDVSEDRLGRALEGIAAAYAASHRSQLASVFTVWRDIAAGLKPGAAGPAPDLENMGRTALQEFKASAAAV